MSSKRSGFRLSPECRLLGHFRNLSIIVKCILGSICFLWSYSKGFYCSSSSLTLQELYQSIIFWLSMVLIEYNPEYSWNLIVKIQSNERRLHPQWNSRRTTLDDSGKHRWWFLHLWHGLAIYLFQLHSRKNIGIDRDKLIGKKLWGALNALYSTGKGISTCCNGRNKIFREFDKPSGRWFLNRCFPRKGGGISVYFKI